MLSHVVLGVVLGAAFLYVFYRALEVGWPANYFSVSSTIERGVSVTLWRYALFRVAPVFLVAVFVDVSVDRASSRGAIAALLLGAVHVSHTHGRALVGVIARPSTDPARNPLVVLNVAVAAAVMLVVIAAGLLGTHLEAIVPPLEAVASDLWTAVGAAVIGAYLANVVTARSTDVDEFIVRSSKSVPSHLLNKARTAAINNGADPDLVVAEAPPAAGRGAGASRRP